MTRPRSCHRVPAGMYAWQDCVDGPASSLHACGLHVCCASAGDSSCLALTAAATPGRKPSLRVGAPCVQALAQHVPAPSWLLHDPRGCWLQEDVPLPVAAVPTPWLVCVVSPPPLPLHAGTRGRSAVSLWPVCDEWRCLVALHCRCCRLQTLHSLDRAWRTPPGHLPATRTPASKGEKEGEEERGGERRSPVVARVAAADLGQIPAWRHLPLQTRISATIGTHGPRLLPAHAS